ncbi:PDZ domain-containing protein [Smittium mucronatum]|uniref:PDZ domain-containing protein n=1 Tax=Smittium mucronatum TaxID=133383 RepID=A0A1R0GQJ5_9FUNG|nr:PDZ domain-containing protein [Smittium mucronatum]
MGFISNNGLIDRVGENDSIEIFEKEKFAKFEYEQTRRLKKELNSGLSANLGDKDLGKDYLWEAKSSQDIDSEILYNETKMPSNPNTPCSFNNLESLFRSEIPSDYNSNLEEEKQLFEIIQGENADFSKINTWDETLQNSMKAIVSIKTRGVRAFDTEHSYNSYATGFIVNSENGIILSNRHVVGPGPTVSEAIFYNYEAVDLMPIYYDPVHDFGFFKFDPTKVKFTQIVEIKLAPHLAKVGLDIRVVGNDSNEKLSISSGTLARLDRHSPEYGIGNYNDFNTFYYQASTGTSGGSSGSPVLEIGGNAVALNAGSSNDSNSAFYLPLNQVEVALNHLLNGEPIPRGTLQVEFIYQSYDILRRLGLTYEVEKLFRKKFPSDIGMLSVKTVLPEGPANNLLYPGDIIISINETPLIHFLDIDRALNRNVNRSISFVVLRNKSLLSLSCKVQDLYSITTSRLVEVGGGIVHDLSYQVARSYNVPVKGVMVSKSGHTLNSAEIQRYHIITSLNNRKIINIEDFVEAISSLTYGSKVPVKYYPVESSFREIVSTMDVTTDWFPFQMVTRNHETGLWDYKPLNRPVRSDLHKPLAVHFSKKRNVIKPANMHIFSVVYIDFDAPFMLENIPCNRYYGPGYIIDKDQGLVLCDRNTVMLSAGDINITFSNSTSITARVFYLHPVYNVAIIKYNPNHIICSQLTNLQMSPEYYDGKRILNQGDSTTIISFDRDNGPVVRKTNVAYKKIFETKMCHPPRWRSINTEAIFLEDDVSRSGGIFCDENGLVTALLLSYSYQDNEGHDLEKLAGLDISSIKIFLESIKSGDDIVVRSLDVDISELAPYLARSLGMDETVISEVDLACNGEPKFYKVDTLLSVTSQASELLKTGDILVKIDGKYVTNIKQVSVIHDKSSVFLDILRDGKMLAVNVPTTILPNIETSFFLEWAGSILQTPHRPVHECVKTLPSMIYVLFVSFGSPSDSYELDPRTFITHIDGIRVYTIFDFIKVLKQRVNNENSDTLTDKFSISNHKNTPSSDEESFKDLSHSPGEFTRLTVVDYFGASRIISMKLDEHYYPTIFHYLSESSKLWKCEIGLENVNI